MFNGYFMKDAHINQLINLMTNFLDGQWLDTGLPALWSFHCILFMILNSWWEESTNILCLQKNMFSQLYRFTWILLTCSSTSLWLLERPEETKWERTNYFYLYTNENIFSSLMLKNSVTQNIQNVNMFIGWINV